MKAVRIKLAQNEATFSHPLSHSNIFTYLLPPPSTVIGMIHNLCKWTTYHRMNVSICSVDKFIKKYDGLESRWFIGKFGDLNDDNKKRWSFITEKDDGSYQGAVKSPKVIHHVADLNLVLHIIPDNQKDIEYIYNSVLYPNEYPSLGKHHSIIDIKEVKIVDILEEKKITSFDGIAYRKYESDIEFPDMTFKNNVTIYNLHKDYKIVNGRRVFNNVKAMLYCGCSIENKNFVYEYVDEDRTPIFII